MDTENDDIIANVKLVDVNQKDIRNVYEVKPFTKHMPVRQSYLLTFTLKSNNNKWPKMVDMPLYKITNLPTKLFIYKSYIQKWFGIE